VQLWCLINEAIRPPSILNLSKHKINGVRFIFSEKSVGKVKLSPFPSHEVGCQTDDVGCQIDEVGCQIDEVGCAVRTNQSSLSDFRSMVRTAHATVDPVHFATELRKTCSNDEFAVIMCFFSVTKCHSGLFPIIKSRRPG